MMEGIARELQQFQQYAAGLQKIMKNAEALRPEHTEGTDSTRVVKVVLDSAGIPSTIRIKSGWTDRIPPDEMAAAIYEAFQMAAGERMSIWTRSLEQAGWKDELDLPAGRPSPEPEVVRNSLPPAFRKRSAAPRTIDRLAEDMISAFDDVEEFSTPPEAPHAIGSAASRRVTITLAKGAGLVSCEVDPTWAMRQSAVNLMTALGEALSAARRQLAEMPEPPAAAGARLDELLSDAMTLLQNPDQLSE